MIRMPTPRLLPITIGVLGGLLAVKSVTLVRAVFSPASAPGVTLPGVALPGLALITSTAQASSNDSEAAARPAAAQPAPDPEPKPPAEPPVSASEKAVLMELRQRRQELEARESAIAARESVLTAAEQKLSARVAELQSLQGKLESLEAGQRQRDDASWQGLVKLYETMKPREAAAIFNELSMPVLLQVLDRMKDAKAATVLAAMNPDKARDVTTELARMRTRRDGAADPVPASAAAPAAAKATPPTPPPASPSTPPRPRAVGS